MQISFGNKPPGDIVTLNLEDPYVIDGINLKSKKITTICLKLGFEIDSL